MISVEHLELCHDEDPYNCDAAWNIPSTIDEASTHPVVAIRNHWNQFSHIVAKRLNRRRKCNEYLLRYLSLGRGWDEWHIAIEVTTYRADLIDDFNERQATADDNKDASDAHAPDAHDDAPVSSPQF